jgi:hypothetical protein
MLETRTKDLDGHTYEVTQLPAMRGMKLLTRIGRAIGPALAKLATSDGTLDTGNAGAAMEALFSNLTEGELEHFIREMLLQGGALKQDGRPLSLAGAFDLEMAGKPMTILKLLVFAFEANYGDFYAAAGALLAPAASPKAVANPSQESIT